MSAVWIVLTCLGWVVWFRVCVWIDARIQHRIDRRTFRVWIRRERALARMTVPAWDWDCEYDLPWQR